ncbi:MAG: hypothetical protein ACXVMS_05710 [Flavisolibacter sp.]
MTAYMQPVPIQLAYRGRTLSGEAEPLDNKTVQGIPLSHGIYIQGKFMGILRCKKQGWVMDRPADLDLVESLGEYLRAWYE